MWRQRRSSSQCHQEPRPEEKQSPADKQTCCRQSNNNNENKTRTNEEPLRASDFGLKPVLRRVADRKRLCDGDDGGVITYKDVSVAFVSILDDRKDGQ